MPAGILTDLLANHSSDVGTTASTPPTASKHPTNFYLNCDEEYQIAGLPNAIRFLMPPPFEHECRFVQRRFDMMRREVAELPEKCPDKHYIYKASEGQWFKCCQEILGVTGLFSARPQLACKVMEPAERMHVATRLRGREHKLACFEAEKENRITLGYTTDPNCVCPEGENGNCWCPFGRKECISLGQPDKANVNGAYNVYYIS